MIMHIMDCYKCGSTAVVVHNATYAGSTTTICRHTEAQTNKILDHQTAMHRPESHQLVDVTCPSHQKFEVRADEKLFHPKVQCFVVMSSKTTSGRKWDQTCDIDVQVMPGRAGKDCVHTSHSKPFEGQVGCWWDVYLTAATAQHVLLLSSTVHGGNAELARGPEKIQ